MSVYSFNASETYSFTDSISDIKFDIPSGVLVDKNGIQFNGTANLKVGFLDALSSDLWNSMPGGYKGYLADGSNVIFESFNALYFDFEDHLKNPLYIR